MKNNWCEHLDKSCRYTTQKYNLANGEVVLRVQTWICPECGVHGADTEIVEPQPSKTKSAVG
jgi:hypothetical protein